MSCHANFGPAAPALRASQAAAIIALLAPLTALGAGVEFERDIAPILATRCLECHSDVEAAGGLVLTTKDRAFAGGESGPAIVPGSAQESYLLDRVASGEMPPEKHGVPQPLSDQQIALLRSWIESGAEWPDSRRLDPFERTTSTRAGRDWWSLQPVVRPPVPASSDSNRPANPVDSFILSRLKSEGLEPAPQADRRTLVRRVYYDVIGLPPTAEEIDAFVADDAPDAYERLVDHLLDSPQFGERWARYWLDVVRYADTSGYERDQEKPQAWKYRDWVVRSLNEDKPFDRFVTEQLAGDELPGRSEETVVATGFLRLGTWNDEPNEPEEYQYERLEDLVQATTAAFLGLTVKCARCHDHKFDPIAQTDYYRVANAFWPGPIAARDRELLGGPTRQELPFDVLGWTDVRDPPPLFLMKKGDPHQPLFAVEPGNPSIIPALASLDPMPHAGPTTGRRLRLAKWITHPENPLAARVFVNRLWQRHFGEGLVRSPDNFGFLGERPTHPELLDWLASEFTRGGGRAKPIHRLLLTSNAYRQAAVHPRQADYATRDPDNRLRWRADRRRLDAETLRDSMLAASGRLDSRIGGPAFRADVAAEALEGLSMKAGAWQPSPPSEQSRRSLYLFSKRSLLPPLMTVFDFCGTTEPCGRREETTVVSQALALLNNQFVHEQSRRLAARVIEHAGDDQLARVDLAWHLALGRSPTADDRRAALAHLDAQQAGFDSLATDEPRTGDRSEPPFLADATLRLRADAGVVADQAAHVSAWSDLSAAAPSARQPHQEAQPTLAARGAVPVVRFDGVNQFLRIDNRPLTSPQFTVAAVAAHRGAAGHREIFSNWRAAGNSTTSVFLGTTDGGIRFSDDLAASAAVPSDRLFLLVATNGDRDASLHLNGEPLASKGSPLTSRRLDAPYVIGTQGDFGREHWDGDVAELLVFNRALENAERDALWRYARDRYALGDPQPAPSPDRLAFESLCHVLLNTNEFLYVD